jgi:hypothetical protein
MARMTERVEALAWGAREAGAALLQALWPRSDARREVERLTDEGYAAGTLCDVDFVVAFDTETAEHAIPAVCLAGFAVGDRTHSSRGVVTVRRRVRLRPYDLSRATARLSRAVTPYGGFAAIVGPTR